MKTDLLRNLSPEQMARIQRAVDASGDPTDGQIVREALRLWDQHAGVRTVELEVLKREYAEGKASGEPEDIDPVEFLKGLKAERARSA
jgi:antitoxin ParD1/3/4